LVADGSGTPDSEYRETPRCSCVAKSSSAASANVRPVRTIPGRTPRSAWSRTSRNQACAVHFMK
jgi:hypothetical protein